MIYFKIEKITGQDNLICSFTSQQDQRDSIFSRQKRITIPIINLVNCQSDTSFKILRNVFIGTFVILKIFIYYK